MNRMERALVKQADRILEGLDGANDEEKRLISLARRLLLVTNQVEEIEAAGEDAEGILVGGLGRRLDLELDRSQKIIQRFEDEEMAR